MSVTSVLNLFFSIVIIAYEAFQGRGQTDDLLPENSRYVYLLLVRNANLTKKKQLEIIMDALLIFRMRFKCIKIKKTKNNIKLILKIVKFFKYD